MDGKSVDHGDDRAGLKDGYGKGRQRATIGRRLLVEIGHGISLLAAASGASTGRAAGSIAGIIARYFHLKTFFY